MKFEDQRTIMINKPLDPRLFNIDILVLNKDNTPMISEVSTLNSFQSKSKVPDTHGFFSEEIFGPIGSSIRNTRPGYIELYLPILHPLVYETLLSLNGRLEALAKSKVYATFDKKKGEFIFNTEHKGETGYSFLIDHIEELKFDNPGNSEQRDYKIKFMNKYLNKKSMSTRWLVLPAGLRDYRENSKGVPEEDEINTLYRKLLSTTNMIKNTKLIGGSYKPLDPIRLKIQDTVCEIFDYIRNLIEGKTKFIQSKYSKRAIVHGTRNVITANPVTITNLKHVNNAGFNHTIVGLYQYVKAISPIAMNKVSEMFINKIISHNTNTAYLINPKTMKSELVDIGTKKRDEWITTDGLNDIMNRLGQANLRLEPVTIDGYYIALVYDTGKDVTVYLNTDYIPDDIDVKNLRPITYVELFYISIYEIKDKYPGFVTRYPVINLGSIYPTYLYVKTTSKGRTVNFKMDSIEMTITEYPIFTEGFVESLSPSVSRLAKLGGDHDGDVVSLSVLYSDESIAEINKYLESKEAYISPEGEITFSSSDTTVDLVVMELSE